VLPVLTFGKYLEELVRGNESADAVLHYIQNNIPQDVQEEPSFIRSVTRTILTCMYSVKGNSYTIERRVLEQYDVLLRKLVADNLELQTNILTEIQSFSYNLKSPKEGNPQCTAALLTHSLTFFRDR
jgi:hypothetical protein